MASNITVKIHAEPYIINYVTQVCSKNKSNPIIFPRNDYFLKILLPLLISKREYDFRMITEKDSIKLPDESFDIMLPWQQGKIDIRVKHYISPKDEKDYLNFLKSYFSGFAFVEIYQNTRVKKRKWLNETIMNFGQNFGIIDDPILDTIKRKIYRMKDKMKM